MPNFAQVLESLKTIQNIHTPEELMLKIDRPLLGIPDNHLYASHLGLPSPDHQSLWRAGKVGDNAISDPNQIWQLERRVHGKYEYLFIATTRFPSSEDPI